MTYAFELCFYYSSKSSFVYIMSPSSSIGENATQVKLLQQDYVENLSTGQKIFPSNIKE